MATITQNVSKGWSNLHSPAVKGTTDGISITEEGGNGPVRRLIITLKDVSQSIVNGTEYQSTLLATFPEGRILVHGVTGTYQQTTADTSKLAASSTGALSLGTAAASSTTLSSTMVDLTPSTAFTSGATNNVAGTAVNAALAAAAQFDGTSSAKAIYLNTAYATTANVSADTTHTISGRIVITYSNLGDYTWTSTDPSV